MAYKLWVDDIRKEPEGWLRAKTVTEAIRILDTMDIEEVSLDHDISMKVSIGYGDARPFASPETFEPVARFIANMPKYKRPMKTILHSANPLGRDKMLNILWEYTKVELNPHKPCNRFEEETNV